MIKTSEHAILPPSGASHWRWCPGWVGMRDIKPDEETQDSREGAASHEVFEHLLKGHDRMLIGDTARNGVILTGEMIDCAHMFCEEVLYNAAERDINPGDPLFQVESKVYPRSLIHPECWGTPDHWFYDPPNKDLFIHDYKFGHGVVEPFENWQCICYAAGVIELLKALGHDVSQINVWIVIVQPRSHHADGPIRNWWLPIAQMSHYFNELKASAILAMGDTPPCVSGLHCRYCPAMFGCETHRKADMFACDFAGTAVADIMDPNHVGMELSLVQRCIKSLEYKETALLEQAKSYIKGGQLVPHYSVEPARGNLAWTKGFEEVVNIGKAFGVDLQQQKNITPTQAKKLIDETIVDNMSKRPDKGVKLVADDGKKAQLIFNKPAEGTPWLTQ